MGVAQLEKWAGLPVTSCVLLKSVYFKLSQSAKTKEFVVSHI